MDVDVRVKRVYDPPEPDDGYRLLIDHVWPRGISRQRAGLDEWARELTFDRGRRRWSRESTTSSMPSRLRMSRVRPRALRWVPSRRVPGARWERRSGWIWN